MLTAAERLGGWYSGLDVEAMAGAVREVIDVAAAGHDVHLDQPDQWRAVASEFLAS